MVVYTEHIDDGSFVVILEGLSVAVVVAREVHVGFDFRWIVAKSLYNCFRQADWGKPDSVIAHIVCNGDQGICLKPSDDTKRILTHDELSSYYVARCEQTVSSAYTVPDLCILTNGAASTRERSFETPPRIFTESYVPDSLPYMRCPIFFKYVLASLSPGASFSNPSKKRFASEYFPRLFATQPAR
jgi:hypothetical protein